MERDQGKANENERWIDLLQAFEDKYKLLEYEVTFAEGSAESAEEINNPKSTGHFARSHVLLERGTQRCYIEFERASDETMEPSIRILAAFDGKTSTQLYFMGKGHEIGSYHKPKGFIGNTSPLDEDSIRYDADIFLCLDIFPGFYNCGRGITSSIQNAKKAKIVEKPEGILEIHFFMEESVKKPHRPGILPHSEGGPCQTWRKCVLDMNKSGIIKSIEDYVCFPDDPNEYAHHVLNVQHRQNDKGDWIPVSAINLIGFLSGKAVRKYEYKDVLYSHFDPESHINSFRVEFPPDIEILDTRYDSK